MMEEPVYLHQSLPAVLYHPDWSGFPREGKQFDTEEDVAAAIAEGWKDTPAAFGVVTEPSQEQLEAKRVEEFNAKQAAKEPAEARGPGRPRKEA